MTACDSGAVRLWHWHGEGKLAEAASLVLHDAEVTALAVAADGARAITAGADAR